MKRDKSIHAVGYSEVDSPGKTDSMYQVIIPYNKVSNSIMYTEVVKLKLSSSRGLSKMLSHCTPTPCSSNREKYSQPNPKATGESRLWRGENDN